jgi:hypothetical protein
MGAIRTDVLTPIPYPTATGPSPGLGVVVVVVVVIEQSDHDNDNDNDQDSIPGISVTTSVLIAADADVPQVWGCIGPIPTRRRDPE